MGARGILYAVDEDSEAEVLRRAHDEEALVRYMDDLWKEDDEWQVEVDKAWASIHVALGDGQLEYAMPTPSFGVILGGRALCDNNSIIVYKSADDVRNIAGAISALTLKDLLRLFLEHGGSYDGDASREEWRYVRSFWRPIQEFYRKAAEAGRSVIFAMSY